jgi:hypothetical protein
MNRFEGRMLKSRHTIAVGLALVMGSGTVWAQSAHVSVEGGLACMNGKVIAEPGGVKLGDNGCGGRGSIEVGRTGATVFGVLDHWALRGRLSQSRDKGSFVDAGDSFDVAFTERRTVLDAEVGAKTPFGMFGGVSRVTLGLRYASWKGELSEIVTAGPAIGDSLKTTFETSGFGPRIGLRSSIPLGTHWMFESAMGASALFSDSKLDINFNGTAFGAGSKRGTVYSIDSVSMLSYKLNGTENGSVISVGIASDYYFNQAPIAAERVNRYSFGPVARFRMPLQ